MAKLQPVRGTHDLLPEDCLRHRRVTEVFRGLALRFGFGEIATPIFEFSEVFKRTLGETSDVVTKEMYSFTDRGGDEITLRPENTAGIARAFISGGLSQHLPLKFFASGPMFRYERPQKGRLRQFHQLDVEILGVPEPLADIEVIALADQLLRDLGVAGDTTLELNSLGDEDSRAAYRAALVEYFNDHRSALSTDSLLRLDRNPLRILDSKDLGDREVITDAPIMGDYLNTASKDFFAKVKDGLGVLRVNYDLNSRLVRGLDYYTHTAFEFTTGTLGAQGAIIAGGRYDGLIETMGGGVALPSVQHEVVEDPFGFEDKYHLIFLAAEADADAAGPHFHIGARVGAFGNGNAAAAAAGDPEGDLDVREHGIAIGRVVERPRPGVLRE